MRKEFLGDERDSVSAALWLRDMMRLRKHLQQHGVNDASSLGRRARLAVLRSGENSAVARQAELSLNRAAIPHRL